MIPPQLSPDQESAAEVKLFRAFEELENTHDWVVLHSVGIARHLSQSMVEADFVVVAPYLGVLVLEVKGGPVDKFDVYRSTGPRQTSFLARLEGLGDNTYQIPRNEADRSDFRTESHRIVPNRTESL